MLPIIFSAECRRDFRLRKREFIDASDIVFSKRAQFVCELFCVFDFRTNQPEGEDKWKGSGLRPGFGQVPIWITLAVRGPKTTCMAAEEIPRRAPGRLRVIFSGFVGQRS